MKIFGIGTDIVNIKRMENSLKKSKKLFKKRIFSKNEINYCDKKNNPFRPVSLKPNLKKQDYINIVKKAKEYIKLCKHIGGCKFLWNVWCTDRSVDYPKHFPTPFDVSAVHESIWR